MRRSHLHQKKYWSLKRLLFISVLILGNNQILLSQESVEQEFKSLKNDINDALTRQLDILSPQHFKSANYYLKEAQKNVDNLYILKEKIHNQISTSRSFLSSAITQAALSRPYIEDVITTRQLAVSAGAPVYFSNEFQKADDELLKISEDLEKKTAVNTDKIQLLLKNTYSNLELRSIRQQNLGEAGVSILQAVKEGAKQYLPEKYAQALRDYKKARDYIIENRHDTEEIKSRSASLTENAKQLLQMTRELALVKRTSNSALAGVEDVITTTQSSVRPRLSEDKVKQIRNQFRPDEAEVYMQDNVLVFRLRGLKFPPSQAVLEDSDLILLGKVQRLIKEFKNNEVIVEGHTDNIGSKNLNEKIARVRAKTIKDYLLSIDAIAADKISAVGMGQDLPVTSNYTPEGRAQNRRVDILIKL